MSGFIWFVLISLVAFSVAVGADSGSGLERKAFIWALLFSFQGLFMALFDILEAIKP